MKRTLILGTVYSCFLLLIACGQHDHSHGHDHGNEGHSHETEAPKLQLNEGLKWKANPETTQGIANMKELMNNFDDPANSEAYWDLKESLEEEYGLIFKRCTMTGEAHNQLHLYLMPLKDKINALSEEDVQQQKQAFSQLEEHLSVYGDFFE